MSNIPIKKKTVIEQEPLDISIINFDASDILSPEKAAPISPVAKKKKKKKSWFSNIFG